MTAASVLQLIDREIWIVTSADGSRRGGLVATWVSEASLDRERPVMLAGIAPNHFTAELIDAGGAFGLHLITADQVELAWRFALGSGRERDKLAGLDYQLGSSGAPLLEQCLAWLDCRVFARLNGGGRIYYWADVLEASSPAEGRPLRQSELLAAASETQKRLLAEDRAQDVQRQIAWQAAWRNKLPPNLQP